MLFTQDNEVIDLTSDCDFNEHGIKKSQVEPSFMLPKLNDIFLDCHSLHSKEGCFEKINHSLTSLSTIVIIPIKCNKCKAKCKCIGSQLLKLINNEATQTKEPIKSDSSKETIECMNEEIKTEIKEYDGTDKIVIKLSDEDIKELNQQFQDLEEYQLIEEVQEESEPSVSSNTIEEVCRDLKEPIESHGIEENNLKFVCKKYKSAPHYNLKIERKCNDNFSKCRRIEDKEVFNRLNQILCELNLSMEEFFNFDSSLMFDDINLKINGRLQYNVMKKICEETNCIKRPYFLLKRIFKKYSCQNFTYKEAKILKRIVMKLKAGCIINERTILNSFPGKTLKTIYTTIQKIFQGVPIQNFMKD